MDNAPSPPSSGRRDLHYEAAALADFLIAASGTDPDPDLLAARLKREGNGEVSHPNLDAYEHNFGIMFALEVFVFFDVTRVGVVRCDYPDVVALSELLVSILERWGWAERLRSGESFPFDRDDPAVSLNPDEIRRLWQILRRLERSIVEMEPDPKFASALAESKLTSWERSDAAAPPLFSSLRFLDAAAFELLKKAVEELKESPESLSALRVHSYQEQYGIGRPGKHPERGRLERIIRQAKRFLNVAEAGLMIEDVTGCEASLSGYDWRDGEFYACQAASALCDVVYGEDGQSGPSSIEFAHGWTPEVNLGLRRLEALFDVLLNRWGPEDWEQRLIHSDATPERRATISTAELTAFRQAIERIETGLARDDRDPSDDEIQGAVTPPSSAAGLVSDGREVEPTKAPFSAVRLAAILSRRRKATPAALVTLMDAQDSATYEEVARKVHGDGTIDDGAIRANVSRTNRELEGMAAPYRFRCAGGMVHKEPLGRDGSLHEGNGNVTKA